MKKTEIRLSLTVDESGEPVTYTLGQLVNPHELAYLHSIAEQALAVMLSGLLAAPRSIKSKE